MIQFFKKNIESNKKLRTFEIIVLCLLVFTSIGSVFYGLMQIHKDVGDLQYVQSVMMDRDKDEEDYDSDNKVCDVIYRKGDQKLVVSYDYEDYVKLNKNSIKAYEFKTENGQNLYFDHKDVSRQEASHTYKEMMAEETLSVFNLASATFILMLSVAIMMLFSKQFTTYEKSWFISIMVLATILSVLFPEDSANGVNGIIIMILYLLDTFLNILCELLISKQSRYNFLVSVLVEIVEIVSCVVLMYRFATMATTLFFWLPIDIISYINWSKHRDEEDDELMQGKFETPEQKRNETGMSDNLKAGIEDLSGFAMDDVRVHYNSPEPATVQALAYTQGTDIYVAPGQEQHLPHEAWHVAQQMAGRVEPTTEVSGLPVNDCIELEHEADVMGARANNY